MQGFIKLHRRLLESEAFEDPRLLKTWLWILCRANFKPVILNDGTQLKTGEFATSYNRAAVALNCTPNTVRAHFQRLSKMGQIYTRSNTRFTVVSVCNYRSYQHTDGESYTPPAQPTDTPIELPTAQPTAQPAAYRRRKQENKKTRKGGFVFSGSEKRQATLAKWSEYKGKSYTDQQKEALQKSLDGLTDADVELKVNRAIASGWKGLGDLTPEIRDNPQPAKAWRNNERKRAEVHDLRKRIEAARKAGSTETVKALQKELEAYAGEIL